MSVAQFVEFEPITQDDFYAVWLTDGRADWLWAEAAKNNFPLSVHVPQDLRTLAGIANKHPGLRLIVDHLGVPPNHPGTDASFDHLPDLIALTGDRQDVDSALERELKHGTRHRRDLRVLVEPAV